MDRTEPIPVAPRIELMRLFDRLSAKRLIYIHAPAGYGKSFSTRMWLEHSLATSSWVTVTESVGRKPADFCERFAGALLAFQPNNDSLKEIITHKSFVAAPFEFMSRALKAFYSFEQDKNGSGERKYILVMDDLHLITNHDILKRLPELVNSLTVNVTFFFLSRAEPPDSFSELVVKDALAIVDVGHLKFTESEIRAFFASCGQKLTSQQLQNITAMTDGWAIGLNALLLSGNQQPDRKLLSRYLTTFIREQVWEKWDEQRRNFMLRVSVVDELTADFCNAMTGRTDSADILDALVWENAFMSVDAGNVYRFHHLFQDFLRYMLENDSNQLKKELYKKAGDWFYSRGDYYKAVEYYMKCGNKNGVTKGLKFMYNYNSPYAAIEDTVAIIHLSVNGSIVDEYPFLLEVQAWAAFVEGRGTDMEGYLDRYFKLFPKIVLQNPASAQTALMLRCMDYRNSLIELTKSLKMLPLKLFAQANTPSITQNMPLFHRSSRDFTEYTLDIDKSLPLLRKTIGVLVGEEYDTIEVLIRAGFAYEQGNLNMAHELALSANVKTKDRFAPEIKFCTFMILAAVLDAQGQQRDMQKILDGAAAMIENDKAYYLNANFRAFSCRMRLADGDMEAAQDWLKYYADSPHNNKLSFYKLYQHFTTARAHIVMGDYNMAILFLKKLLPLCEQYRRPLDMIETNILLAIAYWKKGRGLQNEAFEPLERALKVAEEYGFIQIFANEGAELSNMLHKLQKRIAQKDYGGEISSTQVKTLFIMTLARAKFSKGLTGSRTPENLKFTEQQKRVMRYLCDGLTQKGIAEEMGLKPSAIKSHMILIYKKLDVSNSVDAMIKIRELGILDEE